MRCQTTIAQKIITQHGDYLLIVKDNQKNLRKAIEQTMPAERAKSRSHALEKESGGIETHYRNYK